MHRAAMSVRGRVRRLAAGWRGWGGLAADRCRVRELVMPMAAWAARWAAVWVVLVSKAGRAGVRARARKPVTVRWAITGAARYQAYRAVACRVPGLMRSSVPSCGRVAVAGARSDMQRAPGEVAARASISPSGKAGSGAGRPAWVNPV